MYAAKLSAPRRSTTSRSNQRAAAKTIEHRSHGVHALRAWRILLACRVISCPMSRARQRGGVAKRLCHGSARSMRERDAYPRAPVTTICHRMSCVVVRAFGDDEAQRLLRSDRRMLDLSSEKRHAHGERVGDPSLALEKCEAAKAGGGVSSGLAASSGMCIDNQSAALLAENRDVRLCISLMAREEMRLLRNGMGRQCRNATYRRPPLASSSPEMAGRAGDTENAAAKRRLSVC